MSLYKAAMIDLGGSPTEAGSALFQEVHTYFTSQPRSSEDYSPDRFRIGRTLQVTLVAGLLVRVEPHYSKETDIVDWEVLRGFPLQSVVIKDGGNHHFPAAGIYVGQATLKGASATVSWQNEVAFPLNDESVEGLSRTLADRTYGGSMRVEQPALSTMSWSLTLTAPSLVKAEKAYAQIRSGKWKPTYHFADVLPDDEKARVIRMATIVREGDED